MYTVLPQAARHKQQRCSCQHFYAPALKVASKPKWSLGKIGRTVGPFLYNLVWVKSGKACIPTIQMDTNFHLEVLQNTLSNLFRSLLYGPSMEFFLPS